MSRKTRKPATVSLPKGVHRVVSRGREYFYYQPGRGTNHVGERVKLPNDPHSPEFWQAVRQAQGVSGPVADGTIGALIDAYQQAWPGLPRMLADSTLEQYRRQLRIVRKVWGNLQAKAVRPSHVQALMEKIGVRPWWPIFPELEAEMSKWEKRPGPFLYQDNGKPFTTNLMWKWLNDARTGQPVIEDVVWHGLRANAVIRLGQHGLSISQICDAVGMSPQMVERYSRYADRKMGGKAILMDFQKRKKNETVKQLKTGKQK